MRRTEQGEDGIGHVALQHVGHPSLPFGEQLRQRRGHPCAPHSVKKFGSRRRGPGPRVEKQHADLTAVEGLIQHREIGDHHREQPEAGGPFGDRDGSGPSGGDAAAEPKREQGRPGRVQSVSERSAAHPDPVHERGAPQDQRVAQQGDRHPADQQDEEEEGRRGSQNPLPSLDRLGPQADPPPRAPHWLEQHPTQAEPPPGRSRCDQGPEHVEQRPDEQSDAQGERDPTHRFRQPYAGPSTLNTGSPDPERTTTILASSLPGLLSRWTAPGAT